MTNIYTLLKFVHIAAVIIFLGNIITGLFWMRQADKTKNVSIISFAIRGIMTSDKWFTIPGVIVITAGGILAAIYGNIPLLRTGWIFWSIILFTLSGVVFSVKVAPLQQKIYRLTLNNSAEFDWPQYRAKLMQWEIWSFIALITPIAATVMMVLKLPVRSIF